MFLEEFLRSVHNSQKTRGANTEAMREIVLKLHAALLQDVTEFMSKRSSVEPLATSKGEQGAC